MGTSSTDTSGHATNVRKLRSFLLDLMEAAEVPAICARVRRVRESITDEEGKRLTQEKAAARVGVTAKAYRKWETTREPSSKRLREIALAFGLERDYFLPTGDLAAATGRVEAEADRLKELGDRLETFLEGLKSRPGDSRSEAVENEPL